MEEMKMKFDPYDNKVTDFLLEEEYEMPELI